MRVSVIIPVFNEETNIASCIRSLILQKLNDFEIIIVDDGSTDRTIEEISPFVLNKKVKISLYRQDHCGPGNARNLGSKYAKGDILVFLDADMTFDKIFLKQLISPIVRRETNGTTSHNEYVSNWKNVWSRCWNIQEGWKEKMRHSKKNLHGSQFDPVFRAILKSQFDKVQGYDPGGYTDDYSLSKKLGYEAQIVNGARFYHANPDNLKEVFYQSSWSAKRKYKFGVIGTIIALIRSSLPVSLIVGILKSLVYKTPQFILFKVVYDFGVFVGIILYSTTMKGSK